MEIWFNRFLIRLVMLASINIVYGDLTNKLGNPMIPKSFREKDEFLNTKVDRARNFKPLWLCDPNCIICDQNADEIDAIIAEISKFSLCSCDKCSLNDSASISVAIIPTLKYKLRNKWRICRNDVFITVSSNDGQVSTYTRGWFSSYLTLSCIEKVKDDVKAFFVEGDILKGLKTMLIHYREILRKGTCEKDDFSATNILVGVCFCAVFVILIITFVCFCRNSGGCSMNTTDISNV